MFQKIAKHRANDASHTMHRIPLMGGWGLCVWESVLGFTVCASNAWVCPMAVTEVRPKFFRQVSIVSLYCSKLHYTTRANRSADSHSLLGLVFDSFQIFLSWWIGCGEGQIFVGIIVKQHEFSKIFSFRWHNGWGGEGGGGGGCNAPPSHHQRLW